MPDLTETSLDNSLHQALGLNTQGLIENRAVTSCLPPSPHGYNRTGTMFNYPSSQDATLELLQRLQGISGYTPPSPYPFNYNPGVSYFQSPYYPPAPPPPPVLNNNYTLPHPARKFSASPMAARHSYVENQIHGARHNSEPRQFAYQYNANANFQYPSAAAPPAVNLQNYSQLALQNDVAEVPQSPQQTSPPATGQDSRSSPLRGAMPRMSSLIKPLSQVGTLTTTDSDGKVRVIVPVPSGNKNSINNNNDTEGLLANLRLTDDFRMNGPPIQRSTSEKVPNRSELMSQVQRAMWARHTTK